MTYIPPIYELQVLGVFDPGIPNRERIVLRPTQRVDLSAFGLIIGLPSGNDLVPLDDNFFWFGPRIVEPPSWIFLYTSPGEDQDTTLVQTGERSLILHWKRAVTVFRADAQSPRPAIIRMGGFAGIPIHPPMNPNAALKDPNKP